MQSTLKVFGGLSVLAFVAACAAPAPEPIQQQVVYGKYGDVIGCEGPAGGVVPCQPVDDCVVGAAPCNPQPIHNGNGNGAVPDRPNPTNGAVAGAAAG